MILEHVVGGTVKQGDDSRLLADEPRHDDKGYVESAGAHELEGLAAAEQGKVPVGDDDIGELRFEGGPVVSLCVDPPPGSGEPLILEPQHRVADMSVTVRNGRFVIPVRREGRAVAGGIVHDSSASGGTLFVDRERRVQVGQVKDEIQAALNRGALVVLFPEGGSSNGQTVLPFKSPLLEPAAQSTHPLSVSAIQYAIADGDVVREVCYWGDHTFFPHLLNLLGKRAIRATVRFAPVQRAGADRKQLAVQLRDEILKLKTEGVP